MIYMLDTNICIYIINKKPLSFLPKLEKIDKSNTLAISSIVLAELQYGVSHSVHKLQNQINLDAFLTKVEILPYCEKAAFFYGEIRSLLQKQGQLIGGNDLLIASHAIAEEAILITNNSSEFKRVKDLKVEIWSTSIIKNHYSELDRLLEGINQSNVHKEEFVEDNKPSTKESRKKG